MTTALSERIDGAYVGLSPQEQRVADFLRRHPEESALYNSTELAQLTGVSKATVSRLFRRLGFTGSREVRDLLRVQRSAGVPVVLQPSLDARDDRFDAQLQRDIDNLQRSYAALDAAGIQSAAAAIAASARVTVVGFRSGFPLALHLKQQLAQARPDVRLVPEHGQSVGEELVGLGAQDVVIVLAIRRRPAGLAAVLAAAAASGARLLVLADPSLRIPAGTATWLITVPVESASPFDSLASAASVISLLAGAVLDAGGAVAASRVAAIHVAYGSLNELEHP